MSPVEYYKHCIEKRKKYNVITVKSSKMRSQFVAANVATYKNRRIFSDMEECSLWTMEPLAAASVGDLSKETRLPSAVEYDQVYVVSGESGSGKTTFGLLTAEFGVYLTSGDIKNFALNTLSADDRNRRVFAAVEGAIKGILGDLFPLEPKLTGKDPMTMSLVLDEFGQSPAFVRGLCAVQDDVRTLLRDIIPFDVNVKIVVIGTGTDIKSMCRMAPTSVFRQHRVPLMRALTWVVCTTLTQATLPRLRACSLRSTRLISVRTMTTGCPLKHAKL